MTSPSHGLDTPLLKVSRPVAACSRCRTAKIKCDGKLPACSACERAGKASTCPGPADEFAKGKERSYVASLEGQCERLEKKIAEAKRRRQKGSLIGDAASYIDSLKPVSLPGGEKGHRKETSDIDDLVGDFGFLSVNATSRDFYGITSSTSFAGLLLTVAVAKELPDPGANATLPPRSEATSIIQHYFDNVYILLPFFIETSFWTSFDAVYQDGGRFAKTFDYWIVHMVLGISSAISSRTQVAQRHVVAALKYAEDVLHPGSIIGIQAILLLAQYSMVDPEHFRTWFLVGSAARVVSDLGIHQEQLSEVHIDKTTLDLRRRVFYCVYSLDRCLSIATGQSFSFTDDSVNVPLPVLPSRPADALSNWRTPLFSNSIEPAIYLFKIRGIQSRAYQINFFSGHNPSPDPSSYVWNLCAEAQNWFNAIPRTTPAHLTIFYQLELFYTSALVLTPSHHIPTAGPLQRIILFEYAIKFVSKIHQIVKAASWPLFFSYLDIQRVYCVASKFIDALCDSYDEILSDRVPEPPAPIPLGTHQPPYISTTERIDSVGRALKCLSDIRMIFQYAYTRWSMRSLLDNFNRASVQLEKRLMQTQKRQQQQLHQQHAQQTNSLPVEPSAYIPRPMQSQPQPQQQQRYIPQRQ
ncbi:hypothetical protein FQN52_008804 [Onygenales sp. PD_12]|nr:hypothetical protein FQN52_008804 [Onygenales sp. PD_12]